MDKITKVFAYNSVFIIKSFPLRGMTNPNLY